MDESEEGSIEAVEWQTLLEGCSTEGNYVHGHVASEDRVRSVLELHRRVTTTAFCVRDSSSLQFNPAKVGKETVRFTGRSIFFSKSSSPCIAGDGVPFIFGGKKILECQFGPGRDHGKRHKTGDVTQQGGGWDHDYAPPSETTGKGKPGIQTRDTRKKGCEAKISIKQVCRFPDYAVSCVKNVKREQGKVKERLLQDLTDGKELTVQSRYYVELPLSEAHTKHTPGGLSGVARTVHPQIAEWIDQLVSEGMTDSREMQATLRLYVKTRMTDTAAPSDLDRAYYPRLKDIKNHIYLAKVRQRVPQLDREDLRGKLPEWKWETVDGGGHIPPPGDEHNPSPGTPEQDEDDGDPEQDDIDADAIPRQESPSLPETDIDRSRRKALEELEVLRAMTFGCTDGPVLIALTDGMKAMQNTFKNVLDASDEGLALPPVTAAQDHSRKCKRKPPETDTTPLPLAKSPARDRSDDAYRDRCGVKKSGTKNSKHSIRRRPVTEKVVK
ncbi:uncharacterized protein LOC136752463 [Amia ocellicauda]|uniref:uncharacterized protein LOC136752463 n=1 Tax=Amia ocellicauda TaxID=2972642 RepID=UPI003463AEEB